MISVPLSFLVSLYLAVFLVRLLLRGRESWRANGLFLLLITLHIVQTLLVGLRWGYGVTAILPLLSTLAGLVPPLSFLAFRDLAREERGLSLRDWPHLLPVLAILCLHAVWRGPIDLVIICTFLGYGAALLWLAHQGPDVLVVSRLDGSLRSFRALQLTGFVLVGSAVTDVAISLDMLFGEGRHSPMLVSVATSIVLLLLGIAAATVGQEEGEETFDTVETPAVVAMPKTDGTVRPATDEDQRVADDLDRLMAERRLFTDTGLNLARLARRLGVPARTVSHAVNRVHGMSVSHYVNNLRVAEACRLLAGTGLPITRVLYDAGFMTKSNFNREFLRVTGVSPSEWRRRTGEGAGPAAPAGGIDQTKSV